MLPERNLSKLPVQTPLKLTLVTTPDLHRDLSDDAKAYRDTHGHQEAVADFEPSVLQASPGNDRGFARAHQAARAR